MRGAPTAGSPPQLRRTSSFHYDPVYDGISASLQHADLHGLSGCFSCFFIRTGIVLEIGYRPFGTGGFQSILTFDFASSAFSKGLLKHKATQVISVDTRLNFPYTSFQKNEVISHFQRIFVNSNHYTKCVLRILSSF